MAEPDFSTETTSTWILTTAGESAGELYEQRVRYEPGSPFPPSHHHPAQDEIFEIESGAMVFVVEGDKREVVAGEIIEIGRGTAHKARNASDTDPAVVRWGTRPALRTGEFFATAARLSQSPLEGAMLAAEFRDVFRLNGPAALVVPVLAGVGRLLGRDLPALDPEADSRPDDFR